jgi:hypothetical protein
MKHLLLFFLLPAITFGQENTSIALLNKDMKKYVVEKGTITYDISGGANGTEVFTFDRFGWRSLKKRTMEFELYGINRTQIQHEISDGKRVFMMSPEEASESMLLSLGGRYHSDSTLLGKTCQVWIFENKSLKQLWVWNGLAIKRISTLGEKDIITTANSIDLESVIDESFFTLPDNYLLKE